MNQQAKPSAMPRPRWYERGNTGLTFAVTFMAIDLLLHLYYVHFVEGNLADLPNELDDRISNLFLVISAVIAYQNAVIFRSKLRARLLRRQAESQERASLATVQHTATLGTQSH